MTLLRFTGVGREFGPRWVLRDVSFDVSAGDRWGITGRNGAGKTTLLRLVLGEDEATEGEIWRHPGQTFSLLRQGDQEARAAGGERQTVYSAALRPFASLLAIERRMHATSEALAGLDSHSAGALELLARYDRDLEEFRRADGYALRARAEATLQGLGFGEAQWETALPALSGGERGRLRLVQSLLAEPDVLLLDEPTNHLDIPSREALEEGLAAFAGTILLISHDRALLSAVATRVWALTPPDGSGGALRIVDHHGTFDEWVRDAAARAREAESPPRPASSEMKPVPASGPDAQAGELSKNEIRRRERVIAELEKRITRYEGELDELERELADPALYAGGGDPGRVRQITELRDAASARLARVYAEWERIGEELAGV